MVRRRISAALLSSSIFALSVPAAAQVAAPPTQGAAADQTSAADQATAPTPTTVPGQVPGAPEQPAASTPSASASVGDIVVTAQRRSQRLQDVPISVAVTTGESIQKAGTTDLLDLATRLPAVHVSTGPQSNQIIVRGVGSGTNAGFEQSVGVFVDGVYRSRSRSFQAGLFDVERIEVLNGPQTTFFGNNTIAGAINITTRKPSDVFGYDAQGLYSPSDGQFLGHAAFTGPITDTLSIRVAGEVSGMEGYTYNAYLNNHGPHMREALGRVSLRWKPSSNFQSDLRVDYARNHDLGTFDAEISGCPPPAGFPPARGSCAIYLAAHNGVIDNRYNFRADVGPSHFFLNMVEAGWTNRLDLGPVAINSITSYNHLNDSTFENATPLPVTGVAGYFYSPTTFNERYGVFSQELRVESTGTGWFSYTFGGYYSHGNLVSNTFSSLFSSGAVGAAGAPVTNANTPISANRNLYQIDQTRSIFGQVTAKITRGLRVNAGLRYTSVKKDATRLVRIGIGGPTASPSDFVEVDPVTEAKLFPVTASSNAPFAQPHRTFDKLMPSANIQYDIVPQVTVYASYTKGFKAGGFSDALTPSQFEPENVNAYEIGIKGSALDRKLFFTLDGFYSKYSGLQQAVSLIGPTGTFLTTVGNAASSVSQGVEATVSVQPAHWVSLNANGSYIDSHFQSYTSAACTALQTVQRGSTCVQDLSGRPLPFAPKFSGTLGVSFIAPVDANEIRLEPNLYYSSSYFLTAQDDPITEQKRYAQFDTRLAFGPADKHWEVSIIGKNLTNAAVANSSLSIGTSPGMAYALLQRARSVAFSIAVRH